MASILAKTYIHVFACSTGDQIRVYSCQLLPRNDVKAKTPSRAFRHSSPVRYSRRTQSLSPSRQRPNACLAPVSCFSASHHSSSSPLVLQKFNPTKLRLRNREFIHLYLHVYRASSACPRVPVVAERRCESNTIETCPSVSRASRLSPVRRSDARKVLSRQNYLLTLSRLCSAPREIVVALECWFSNIRTGNLLICTCELSYLWMAFLTLFESPSLSCLIRGFGTRDGITDSCNEHFKILIAYV